MKPAEFWALTPPEFWWLLEANKQPTRYPGGLSEDELEEMHEDLRALGRG